MKYELYSEIEISDDFNVFDFISTGRKGARLKKLAEANKLPQKLKAPLPK